jgi:hypothetical protein
VLSNANEKSLEFAMYTYTEVVISVHFKCCKEKVATSSQYRAPFRTGS